MTPQKNSLFDIEDDSVLQRRRFENEHKLLEQYRAAIDVSAAVTKTDTRGIISYVNDAFCQMTGYTQEELIGQRHNIVRNSQTPQSLYVEMWETIKAQKVWKGKILNRKKDGTSYCEHTVIVPIIDERGDTVEFIAIRQDMTSLYDQEEYLNRRIEEEVNKNIQETKFSIIGKMAAGITHEINTPLTYVRGNIELMLQDISALDSELKEKEYLLEDANIVLDGVNRIANIVESMREMASKGKELPELSNLYASLIIALTLSHNKAKQITQIIVKNELFCIGMDKDKFNYSVVMQKQRIDQVWVIIINNALDALKHIDSFEERLLEINIEDEENFIVVRFQDNAGGIDKQMLPKIFDPFESNKEQGGIGIGLNVAKYIVEDHKGKIVASNCKNGALFEVYLPKGEL
jgi:PAS domain S-box-containing protein